MRRIYFYIPEYPSAPTGGIKYHCILYEYFKKIYPETYLSGNGKYSGYANKNKLFKILYGAVCAMKIPRGSVVIMSNNCFLHFFIPMFLNSLYKKHKYFLIVHHLVVNEKNEFFRKIIEKYFIKNSDKLLTISNTTKDELEKYGMSENRDIKIVPPGLDEINFEIDKRNYNEAEFKLLSISTIEERKGLIFSIEAINLLRDKNIILFIIGFISESDEYYRFLMNKIKEFRIENKIFFKGRVSKEDIIKYYTDSSAFVFPTLWEGYGMVAAEAMAFGLPVIASDIPALKELIDDNINGLLFEAGNAVDLRDKILDLYNNRKKLQSLSEKAYEKSKKFLSWEKTCIQIYSVIKESYL